MTAATTTLPVEETPGNVADQAAEVAHSAIRSTQFAANAAFDQMSDKVEDVRGQASPLIDRLTAQAQAAARRSADAVRDTTTQWRDTALRASDSTVGYIRDEPIKAILVAAATGALLMALVSLMRGTRGND